MDGENKVYRWKTPIKMGDDLGVKHPLFSENIHINPLRWSTFLHSSWDLASLKKSKPGTWRRQSFGAKDGRVVGST